MLRRQGFQLELPPRGQETHHLRQFAESCRFVYNKALAINTQRYEKKEKRLGYTELGALLPGWKREHPFLSEVPAQALQQALKNLERACLSPEDGLDALPQVAKRTGRSQEPHPA